MNRVLRWSVKIIELLMLWSGAFAVGEGLRSLVHHLENQPAGDARLYDTPFGRVLCARKEVTNCGVNLSDCADAMIYECLTNIRGDDKP